MGEHKPTMFELNEEIARLRKRAEELEQENARLEDDFSQLKKENSQLGLEIDRLLQNISSFYGQMEA